jgi:DNA-binding NarL/FixJ family response regulator
MNVSNAKEKTLLSQPIYVVGPKSLFNSLLAYGMQKEGMGEALVLEEASELAALRGNGARRNPLVLVDAEHTSHERLLRDFQAAGLSEALKYLYAMYNLEPATPCDQEALLRGVRGFFYKRDPLDLFLKGIRSILAGEVWVSRGSLLNLVLQGTPRKAELPAQKTLLTRREMEILAMVSSGARNDEIADKLYISSHTVKTHLYNIFKKIDVPNRLQAALWASKNL